MLVEKHLEQHGRLLPGRTLRREAALVIFPTPRENVVDLLPVITVPGERGMDLIEGEMRKGFMHSREITPIKVGVAYHVMHRGTRASESRISAAAFRVSDDGRHRICRRCRSLCRVVGFHTKSIPRRIT